VLAALGLVVSPRRRDAQRSVLLAGDDLTVGRVAAEVEDLGAAARDAVGARDADLRPEYDLRYRGQAFELTVGGEPDPARLREAFEAAHEERYGYRDADGELELVTVRVTATTPGSDVRLEAAEEPVEEDARGVVFAGSEHEARILRGDLPAGTAVAGPAICELPEATVAVPPGWRGEVHASGALVLDRERET
jgi:N-methylhydantoinase A/oxoprolinase/acetone carboxylase beta subunit